MPEESPKSSLLSNVITRGATQSPGLLKEVEADDQVALQSGNLKNPKTEVTKGNLDLQEIRYLKKLDTPDWNYHVATPALLEKVGKGEMLPFDPVTKRYFISAHDINKIQDQTRFEALLASGSITVLGGNPRA